MQFALLLFYWLLLSSIDQARCGNVMPNFATTSTEPMRTNVPMDGHIHSRRLSTTGTVESPFSSGCVNVYDFFGLLDLISLNYTCYLFVNTSNFYYFNAAITLPANAILIGSPNESPSHISISCDPGNDYALEGLNGLQIENINLINCPIVLNVDYETTATAELYIVHSTLSNCVERPAVSVAGNLGEVPLQIGIDFSRFSNNSVSTARGGAAVYLNIFSFASVDVKILSSVFEDNVLPVAGGTRLTMGGAIFLYAPNLNVTIASSNFSHNANFDIADTSYSGVPGPFSGAGGAVAVFSSGRSSTGLQGQPTHVQLLASLFEDSQVFGSGGSVYINAPYPQVVVHGCTFLMHGSIPATVTGDGGALAIVSPHGQLFDVRPSVQLLSSTCSYIDASGSGGCFFLSMSNLTLDMADCSCARTKAGSNGGCLAVYANIMDFRLTNSTFLSEAYSDGGSVFVSAIDVSLNVENCIFSALLDPATGDGVTGLAKGSGGAMAIVSATNSSVVGLFSIYLRNSSFGNLTAYGAGGAVHISAATMDLTVKDCIFSSRAFTDGGAIYISSRILNLSIESCNFTSPRVVLYYYTFPLSGYANGNGGALAIAGTSDDPLDGLHSIHMVNSTFYSMSQGSGGAAYTSTPSLSLTVEACNFYNIQDDGTAYAIPSAYGNGGALAIVSTTNATMGGLFFVLLHNSLFNYQTAGFFAYFGGYGGAVYFSTHSLDLASVIVRSSVFANLMASHNGSALYIAAGGMNVSVEDCIFDSGYGFGALSIKASSPANASTVSLKSSLFTGNQGGVGAASLSGIDSIFIEDCQFLNNVGFDSAGAVAVYGNSYVGINASRFESNTFVTGFYFIYSKASILTPQKLTARNGAAALFVSSMNSSADRRTIIHRSEFLRNTVVSSYVNYEDAAFKVNNGNVNPLPKILEGGASPGRSSTGAALFQGVSVSISACNMTSNSGLYSSGGVAFHAHLESNVLNVTDCIFLGNSVAYAGSGSLYITSSSELGTIVNITNSIFSDNVGTTGGAVWVDSPSATMTILSTTFASNTAATGQGGALYASGAQLLLSLDGATLLSGNSADSGGAIFFAGGHYELSTGNCSISRNSAATSGGALAVGTGSLRWSGRTTSGTFSSLTSLVLNSAGLYGGALSAAASEFVLILGFEPSMLVIEENSCPGKPSVSYGGGFYLQKTALYVGCPLSITQNAATLGGGIYSSDSQIYLDINGYTSDAAVVIQGNSATVGGGLYLAGSTFLFTAVHNSSSCFAYMLYVQGNEAESGGGAVFSGESDIAGSVAFNSNVAFDAAEVSNDTLAWGMGCGTGNGGALCLALGSGIAALQLNASQLIGNVANSGAGVYARRSSSCTPGLACSSVTLSFSRCVASQRLSYVSFSSGSTAAVSSHSYYYLYFYELPVQSEEDSWGDYLDQGSVPTCISPDLWVNGNQARDNGGVVFLEDESIAWDISCNFDTNKFQGLQPCVSSAAGLLNPLVGPTSEGAAAPGELLPPTVQASVPLSIAHIGVQPPIPLAPISAPLICPTWAGNVAGSGVSNISATPPFTFKNLDIASKFTAEGFLNVVLTAQIVTQNLLPSKSIAIQVLSMSNASLNNGRSVTASDANGTALLNLTYVGALPSFVNSTQTLTFAGLNYAISYNGSHIPEVPVLVPPCGLMQYRPTEVSGCVTCPPNQYSFDVSSDAFTSCYPCPSVAVCNGQVTYLSAAQGQRRSLLQSASPGDVRAQAISLFTAREAPTSSLCSIAAPLLLPQDGYWHANPFSYQVLQCPNSGACSGGCSRTSSLVDIQQQLLEPFWMGPYQLQWGVSPLQTYVPAFNTDMLAQYRLAECAPGYTGNLCGVCVEGYGSRWRNNQVECLQCLSRPLSQLTYAAQVLIPVLLLCVLLYTALAQFNAQQAVLHRVNAGDFNGDNAFLHTMDRDPAAILLSSQLGGEHLSYVPLRVRYSKVAVPTPAHHVTTQRDSNQATQAEGSSLRGEGTSLAVLQGAMTMPGERKVEMQRGDTKLPGDQGVPALPSAASVAVPVMGPTSPSPFAQWNVKALSNTSFPCLDGPQVIPTPGELSIGPSMDVNVLFKFFFSHCQMLMIMNNTPFAFPQSLQNMISLIATLITSASSMFPSADCSFSGSAFDRVITRQLLAIFVVLYITVGLILCLIAIRLIKICYGRTSAYFAAKWWKLLAKSVSSWMLIVLIVTSYYYYPSVTVALLSLFQCQVINASQDTALAMEAGLQDASSYWSLYLDQACYQGEHLVLVLSVGVPGLLLLGLGLPLGIFFYLRSIKHNKGHLACFAFLHSEYHEATYYWEGVLLAEKFLLTAALSGAVFQVSSVQFSIGILVAVTSIVATIVARPYRSAAGFQMALTSLGGVSLSLYLCLFLALYNSDGQSLLSHSWQQAISVLFIVINSCVFASLIVLYVVAVLPLWRTQYCISPQQLESELELLQEQVSSTYGPLAGRYSAKAQRLWYRVIRSSLGAFDWAASRLSVKRSQSGGEGNLLAEDISSGLRMSSSAPAITLAQSPRALLQALQERDHVISQLRAGINAAAAQSGHVAELLARSRRPQHTGKQETFRQLLDRHAHGEAVEEHIRDLIEELQRRERLVQEVEELLKEHMRTLGAST